MPDFRVLYQRLDGQKATRVVTAGTAQEAAGRAAKEGLKVLRVERIDVKVQAAHRSSHRSYSVGMGQGWPDFWQFKFMVTPVLVRWNFILATILCGGYFCILPFQYMSERSEAMQRLAPCKARIAKYQNYLDEAATIEAQVARAEREADQYRNKPNNKIVFQDASDKVRELRAKLSKLNDEASVDGSADVRQRIAREEERMASLQAELPELTPFIIQMLTMPFVWLGIRVAFELFTVMFSVHDRLVEIADS